MTAFEWSVNSRLSATTENILGAERSLNGSVESR